MKKVSGEGNNCCPLIVLDYVHDVWKLPSFTSRGRPEIFREPVFFTLVMGGIEFFTTHQGAGFPDIR